MNTEERFDAALKEFSEAYKDYVMSSSTLAFSKTLSNGYVGNVIFSIKGYEHTLAVGNDGFICVHNDNITNVIAQCFSKRDCYKLKDMVVASIGEVDKQERIKELEKELKKLKGE